MSVDNAQDGHTLTGEEYTMKHIVLFMFMFLMFATNCNHVDEADKTKAIPQDVVGHDPFAKPDLTNLETEVIAGLAKPITPWTIITYDTVKKATKESLNPPGEAFSHEMSLIDSNTEARFAVFEKFLGPNWHFPMYAAMPGVGVEDTFYDEGLPHHLINRVWTFRYLVMETARSQLSDPTRLKATYLLYKSAIIQVIKDEGAKRRARTLLTRVLPFFAGKISKNDREIFKTRRRLAMGVESCEANATADTRDTICRPYHNNLYKFEENYIHLPAESNRFEESKMYEWVERRRTEGGDALVAAYTWCIQDMLNSI